MAGRVRGKVLTRPAGLKSCSVTEALVKPSLGEVLRPGTNAPAVLDSPGAVATVFL
jgi:hypothetical protein